MDQELEAALERLPLQNPVSLAYILNLVEEDESAHMMLTDIAIMKLVQEPEEEEEGAAPEEKAEGFSEAEKPNGLNLTISLLDLSCEGRRVAHRALRQLQFDLRTASTTHVTLDYWLQ